MPITPEQQKKLQKLAKFVENKDMATFENVLDLNDQVEKLDKKVEKIESGIIEVKEELKKKLESELVLEIDKEELKGEDGKDYILTEQDKKEIASSIKVPIVEKVIEKTEVVKEQPIVTEITKEVKIENPYQLVGDKVIQSINSDESELQIKKEKVEGLEQAFKSIEDKTIRTIGANRNLYQLLDMNVANATDGQSIKRQGNVWIPYTPEGDTDEKVKLNASDPTAGYLDDKITGYGFLTTETDPVWLSDKPSYLTSATAASTYLKLDQTTPQTVANGKPLFTSGILTNASTSSFNTYPTTANRNNFTGAVGFTFTVSQNVVISRIGRLYVAGNSQNHIFNLWDANTGTPIATGTILASSSSDANNFKWASITPVTLKTGITYAVALDETNGGDQWLNEWTPSMNSVFTIERSRYSATPSTYPSLGGLFGAMFNTINIEFITGSSFVPTDIATSGGIASNTAISETGTFTSLYFDKAYMKYIGDTNAKFEFIGNRNDQTRVRVTNTNAGVNAVARIEASLGTDATTASFGILGANKTAYGAIPSGGGFFYSSSATGLTIMTDNASAPIVFASGGVGERWRIDNNGYLKATTGRIYPASDSTTALGFYKADGTTAVMTIDTTNSRLGIGTTTPDTIFHIKGANPDITIENSTATASKTYIGTYNVASTAISQFALNRRTSTGAKYDANRPSVDIALGVADSSSYISFEATNTNNGNPIEQVRITPITTTIGHNGISSAAIFQSNSTAVDTVKIKGTANNTYASLGFFDYNGAQTASFGYGNTGTGSYTDAVFFNSANKGMNFGTNGGSNAHIKLAATTGKVGIGLDVSASARLHIRDTTEQLRLGYDASNYLKTTVASDGKVTMEMVGTATDFTITQPNARTTMIFNATAASGASSGAGFIMQSNDGAALASGDRLGFMIFGGYDGATTRNSAGIFAYANGTWSSGVYPADLTFETTVTGTRTEKMRLTKDGYLGIGTGATVSATLHSLATTEQLRLGYDASNYLSTTVASTGSTTFALTGTSPIFTFSQAVKGGGGFQSSDGTAGATGTQVIVTAVTQDAGTKDITVTTKTITYKNGLITNIT